MASHFKSRQNVLKSIWKSKQSSSNVLEFLLESFSCCWNVLIASQPNFTALRSYWSTSNLCHIFPHNIYMSFCQKQREPWSGTASIRRFTNMVCGIVCGRPTVESMTDRFSSFENWTVVQLKTF